MKKQHMKPISVFALLIIFVLLPVTMSFADPDVPTSIRAQRAISDNADRLRAEALDAGLRLGDPIYIRIFKEENVLELWVQDSVSFKLFKSYDVCTWGQGTLGPKTQTGDGQAPEGFYHVTPQSMNPWSDYHLSFNLGYPNTYDRFRGRTGSYLMVHGRCVSIGCFAMTDPAIEEIYTFCDSAFRNGLKFFRVHIFPFRMREANMVSHKSSSWYQFWLNLKEGYDFFEQHTYIPPNVETRNGKYVFNLP